MNQHQQQILEKIKEISSAPTNRPNNPSPALQEVGKLTMEGIAMMEAIKIAITNDIKKGKPLDIADVIKALQVWHTTGVLMALLHDLNDKEIMEELLKEME